MISVHDALHIEQQLKGRTIEALLRQGQAAIENCLVYSSDAYVKGGNITLKTMYNGEEGYFFINQDKDIFGIIRLEDIRGEVKIQCFSPDEDIVTIFFGPYNNHYSLYLSKKSMGTC